MNVIITGVSRGIGKALVTQFLKNDENIVIGVSRNASDLLQDENFKNNNLLLIDFDFLKDDYQKLFEIISARVKTIDCLINNSGWLVNKPFSEISDLELKNVYEVNVFAPFKLIQVLLPFLMASNKAHVVNISSMGGVQGSMKFAGLSAYSSSKAAIASLTECLAEELKDTKIHINALAIGAVQTEMLREAFPDYQAPLQADEMANYIYKFAIEGWDFFNGKIIQVSSTTP